MQELKALVKLVPALVSQEGATANAPQELKTALKLVHALVFQLFPDGVGRDEREEQALNVDNIIVTPDVLMGGRVVSALQLANVLLKVVFKLDKPVARLDDKFETSVKM